MKLSDIIARNPYPVPWAECEKIPWNEPGFSERMLREHLSQDHDWARLRSSNRFSSIRLSEKLQGLAQRPAVIVIGQMITLKRNQQ